MSMVGQGILMRKVSIDKTLNQLIVFLKGATLICLLYFLNGGLIQKNLALKDIIQFIPMYSILIIGFILFAFLKKKSHNHALLNDLYENFQVSRFEEIKKLDRKLMQQIKKDRKFISNNGQVVGTSDYVLVDFRDGQFQLLPAQMLKAITIEDKGKQCLVKIALQHKSVQLMFRNRKEAKEFADKLKKQYSLPKK